jgi:hypothetical protein
MLDAQARAEVGQTQLLEVLETQDREISVLESKADQMLKHGVLHEQHLHNQDIIMTDIQRNTLANNSQTTSLHAVASAIHQEVAEVRINTTSVLRLALDIMNTVTAGISKVREIAELMTQMTQM